MKVYPVRTGWEEKELTKEEKEDLIYSIMLISPNHANLMNDLVGFNECLRIIKEHRK